MNINEYWILANMGINISHRYQYIPYWLFPSGYTRGIPYLLYRDNLPPSNFTEWTLFAGHDGGDGASCRAEYRGADYAENKTKRRLWQISLRTKLDNTCGHNAYVYIHIHILCIYREIERARIISSIYEHIYIIYIFR